MNGHNCFEKKDVSECDNDVYLNFLPHKMLLSFHLVVL